MKERGIIVCALSVGFIYLVARLARLAYRATFNHAPNEPARLARLLLHAYQLFLALSTAEPNEPNEPLNI